VAGVSPVRPGMFLVTTLLLVASDAETASLLWPALTAMMIAMLMTAGGRPLQPATGTRRRVTLQRSAIRLRRRSCAASRPHSHGVNLHLPRIEEEIADLWINRQAHLRSWAVQTCHRLLVLAYSLDMKKHQLWTLWCFITAEKQGCR
jgi:hypothetical protein